MCKQKLRIEGCETTFGCAHLVDVHSATETEGGTFAYLGAPHSQPVRQLLVSGLAVVLREVGRDNLDVFF